MHLNTCISALMAVIGGVSALPPPDLTPEVASPIQTADPIHVPQQVNNMTTEQDALLSYLFGWNNTALQSKIPRAKLWDDDDIVPIEELPPCYHKCMVDNCCNMASDGAPDIREMTTNDFCRIKFIATSGVGTQHKTGLKGCAAIGNKYLTLSQAHIQAHNGQAR
ncbi:hypothetical protein DL769_000882 [Monosporascus sp. CRB-8-3]|nr:hypothetical protein DL769_000882 [Monosporascus sp. CRB-8-3]